MKTNIKKSLKFITLLISTLLIGTASAAIYYSLQLSATVGVASLKLAWNNQGLDEGVNAQINGVYCTLSGLNAPIGGNATYEKAIGIEATAATTFDIEVVDVTGSNTTNLDYIKVELFDANNQSKGDFYVWQNNQKGTGLTNLSISNGEVWRLQWTIAWKTSAQSSDSVTVSLKVTTPSPP
jgi:hypothetical protein